MVNDRLGRQPVKLGEFGMELADLGDPQLGELNWWWVIAVIMRKRAAAESRPPSSQSVRSMPDPFLMRPVGQSANYSPQPRRRASP